MKLELRPLGSALAQDFHQVMERANPEARQCLCTSCHLKNWQEPAAAREHRERLLSDGPADGFVLYRDGVPVGWCQASPRRDLARLRPDPRPDAGGVVWAITCLVLVPEAKGQGLGHSLLALAIAEARAGGATRVQAEACRYAADEDAAKFIEFPESLCRKAGMTLVLDHAMRPIYEVA